VLKGIIHAIIILLLILVGSVFYNSMRFQAAPYSSQVLGGVQGFMTSTGLIGNYMFIYMGVLLTLVLLTINEQLGPGRLRDLLMGRYNRAIKEQRIFMFLDLRSSTLLAEKLGHELYFGMLNKFFADITEPILEYGGKIYQYVGDEIVLTWSLRDPVKNQRCLFAFRRMQEVIESEKSKYLQQFGSVPEFKAGLHCGEVTTGEVGMIKKEIIHTGDVLNTTARIEKICNEFQQSLILSKDLMDQLPERTEFNFVDLGIHELKGKENATRLFGMLDQFQS
jgi:adenylate cyclase